MINMKIVAVFFFFFSSCIIRDVAPLPPITPVLILLSLLSCSLSVCIYSSYVVFYILKATLCQKFVHRSTLNKVSI